MNRKYDRLVRIPENKTLISAFTQACRHNNKLGSLLEYFHYNASIEACKQGLTIGIEEITITRTLDNIISGLNSSGRTVSKKTIIEWIVKLQSLNYIHADGPHHKYTVCLKNIQVGIDTPPPVEKAKLRGIHARRAAIQANSEENEHCNFTMLPKTTMSQENSVILDLDIVKLQSDIVDLQSLIVKLQSDIVDLQSSNSRQAACIADLEAKISPYYSNTILHTIGNTIDSKADTPPPTQPPLPLSAISLSQEGERFYALYCSLRFIKVKPKLTQKLKDAMETLAPHFHTTQQLYDFKKFMDTKTFFKGKGFTPGLMVVALNDWLMTQDTAAEQAQAEQEPEEAPEDEESRLIVWNENGLRNEIEAKRLWFTFRFMTVAEARNYGFSGRELVSSARKTIANLLEMYQRERPDELAQLRAEYQQRVLIPA